ncbi:hypothetical protein B7R78_0011415 [Ralstonia solanacearum]|uniref:hypothetical protein n=1 Tax=Ralstonia solanacearum TaxID=305 RepID=UPI00114347DC|nr:hypothetical protein [Ralstonia solanacearum]MBT1537716.1 hypothetical protein [Ralstonia solanacearum]
MATKPKQAKLAKRDPAALEIVAEPGEKPEASLARIAISPVIRGAATGRKYAQPMFGDGLELTAYAAQLQHQADKVKAGDMSAVETMLVAQANTLDMIFNQSARKAAHSEYLNQMQAHMSLALKAQSQCRATLEALNEIKNPRPVAFVRQANFANGPQQVNNAPLPRAHGNSPDQSTELLEHSDGEWLDTGTTSETRRGHQTLEAVGAVHWPEK